MSPQGGPHTIENNKFVGNSSLRGGAINFPFLDKPAVIKGNLFSGNIATNGGGAVASSTYSTYSATYENNTFFRNQADTGGAATFSNNAIFKNNTFSNNKATNSGGNGGADIYFEYNVNATLTNNILANNEGGGECRTTISGGTSHIHREKQPSRRWIRTLQQLGWHHHCGSLFGSIDR